MNGQRALAAILCLSLVVPMVGCGGNDYGQYAQAVKEQNITRQLKMETAQREREYSQMKHEEKMLKLTGSLVMAAGKTTSPNDDMMVPLVMMMMEDKWAMANLAAQANAPRENLAPIKAPDSFGDTVQKSTGALLGIAGLALAWRQSDNLTDVATAGIAAAGVQNNVSGEGNTIVNDSYKSGTDNVISGDGTIDGGPINGSEGSSGEEDSDSTYPNDEWYSPGCSQDSHAEGRC